MIKRAATIRRPSIAGWLTALSLGALTALPASGQTAVGPGAQHDDPLNRPAALDPGVGDAGPFATSLRVIDRGLGMFSHRGAVTAVRDPTDAHNAHERPYEYNSPGLRAMMRRVDTVVRASDGVIAVNEAAGHDGQFVRIIPADTVFNLTPDDAVERPAAPEPEPAYLDQRVSYRVDYQVTGAVADHAPRERRALLPDRHIPRPVEAGGQPPATTQPAD